MHRSKALRLLFVGLLTFLSPCWGRAASAAEDLRLAPLPKWIPDDAYGVITVNVKEMHARNPRTSVNRKKLESVLFYGILTEDLVQPPWLSEAGARSIPAHIDRVVELLVPKTNLKGDDVGSTWIALVQGKFDVERFNTMAEEFVRDNTGDREAQSYKAGKKTIYEVDSRSLPARFHYCLINSGLMVVTPEKSRMEQVIKNTDGGRDARPKNAAMKKWLEKSKCSAPIEVFVSKDYVVERSERSHVVAWQRIEEVRLDRLRDFGIEAIEASATIEQDLKLKVRVTTESEDRSKECARAVQKKLTEARDNLRKDLQGVKVNLGLRDLKKFMRGLVETGILGQFLKTITVSSEGETVSIEMHGSPNLVWTGVVCYLFQ